MKVYISSSWKNRQRVRALAEQLRGAGHEVYDFTDPASRGVPEIPPEAFTEQFDPDKHVYRRYIQRSEWREAVMGNKRALDDCDVCVLLLPCGNDAHADWAYAVGRGRVTAVVGAPRAGERTPTHMWADVFLDEDADVVTFVGEYAAAAASDEAFSPTCRDAGEGLVIED